MYRITAFAVLLAGIVLATVAGRPAAAGILLHDNVGGGTPNIAADLFAAPEGVVGLLSRIDVGGADVEIEQFGVFGRSNTGGNIKFAIFDALATTRLYVSGAIPVAAAEALQWYDSPLLTPTLALTANDTFWFGLIADHSFDIHFELPAAAETEGGLTSPEGGVAGSNGAMLDFDDPVFDPLVLNLDGPAQVSLRVFGPGTAMPEPTPLALLGIGLIALGFMRRKDRSGRVNDLGS